MGHKLLNLSATITLQDQYDEHIRAGISDLHPTALSRFKTGLVAKNKAQGNIKSDAQMAASLATAARNLGDLVAIKVDIELKGGDGSLKDTNMRLRALFTDLAERELRRKDHDGRALAGQAPRDRPGDKHDPQAGNRDENGDVKAWRPGMDPCRHCGDNHLHKLCPKHIREIAQKDAKRKRKASAKAAREAAKAVPRS